MANETIEILKLLINKKEDRLSIRKISQIRKINYKSAYNALMALGKEKIASLQKTGNTTICTFNNNFNTLVFEAEYERRKELLKNNNIAVMHDSFKGLHSKLHILLVFGSYAKKTQTKHSDIDLMFIVPDSAEERMEKEIQSIADTLPLKIHINIFKETDFRAMKNSKEITVGSEAIKNNIILHGIESYYEMIQ